MTTQEISEQVEPVPDAAPTGAFRDALVRSNRKIKTDRAEAIVEVQKILSELLWIALPPLPDDESK
jgi:hypothetical protein